MNDNINEIEPNNIDSSAGNSSQSAPYGREQYTPPQYGQPYTDAPYGTQGSCNYVSQNSQEQKKSRSHPVLKTIAFILCLAIAGVGSVQGYRIYQDHKDNNGFSEFNEAKDPQNKQMALASDDTDDDNSAEMPSLIELASRDNAKSIPDIVDEIMPSVVGVSATFEYTASAYDFFGWSTGGSTSKEMVGRGTGIIISEDGYIVTNAHCIYDDSSQYRAGEAIEVSVRFSDESEHNAKIIAYDTDTDIAVLKVDETGLKPATFGSSDDLRVGELVIAVGNPLGFDLFGSVTSGIVSAKNRQISVNGKNMNLLQTDTAINEGNSGGPLLNSSGQVIGINSAKISSSYGSASVEGLCFAIPISDAKSIIDDLINYNYVTGRPKFGVSAVNVTESDSRRYGIPMGAYITLIEEDSAAEKGGLKVRDIIIDIDGDTVSDTTTLNTILNKHKAGDTISVTINRNGEDITFDVTLQEDQANMNSGKKNSDAFMPTR